VALTFLLSRSLHFRSFIGFHFLRRSKWYNMTNNAWEWNWLDLYFIGAYILYLSNALFVRASGEIKGGCALAWAELERDGCKRSRERIWFGSTRWVSSRTETNCAARREQKLIDKYTYSSDALLLLNAMKTELLIFYQPFFFLTSQHNNFANYVYIINKMVILVIYIFS
jgi:hypothetical protein